MGNTICYLIIDDTEERELLETAIRETELGYESASAKSFERAIERFNREPDFRPDYIFMSWNAELLKKIKAIPRLTDVPVIVYTAEINTEGLEEAKRLGAAHCLLKTTHEIALTRLLLKLFKYGGGGFVLVYPAEEEQNAFLR